MSDDEQSAPAQFDRYVRQMRYAPLGVAGQQRLSTSYALVCGCGALGSVIADTLARSGVGRLRIVDRDFLETNNLQRQVLFDEDDVAAELPKAIAAAAKLRRINSTITIEPVVADLGPTNIAALAEGVDVIVDGTDNFETRFLINDFCVQRRLPWIYGGCLGAEGQTMTIVPGETSCLRCLMPEPPPPGVAPTCDTAGIVAPIVHVVAAIQSMEAIKILSGNASAIQRGLTVIDLWENRLRQVRLDTLAAAPNCPACVGGEFPWLAGDRASYTAILCGRDAVQLNPALAAGISLEALAQKLAGVGPVTRNRYLLRLAIDGYQITVFPDGRAIIGGTEDIATARTLYAKYIGA